MCRTALVPYAAEKKTPEVDAWQIRSQGINLTLFS
jgi:hypothetical protein